jgi:hypothetical protein
MQSFRRFVSFGEPEVFNECVGDSALVEIQIIALQS